MDALTPGAVLTAFAFIPSDAAVPGAVLTADASVLPGTVTIYNPEPEQPSSGISGPMPVLFSLPADVPGQTLACRVRIMAGRPRAVSFRPGSARAGAKTNGSVVQLTASVAGGQVAAERNMTDEEMLLLFAEAA